jgi:phosphoenolpyruvate-protein phosphotransferase
MLHFTTANVQTGAHAKTKEDAIRQVSQLLVENGNIDPRYTESMLQREELANTYLGNGIAIPHGLPADRELIRETGIAVLQLPEGVEWQPSNVVRIVVGIAAKSDEHLDLLAKLTELLSQDELVELLAKTPDASKIVAALVESASAERAESGLMEELSADAASVEALVGPPHGLHARPAAEFVTEARRFHSTIQVRYGSKRADGKSLAALLQLGVDHGETVQILADGVDAENALRDLKAQMEAVEVQEPSRKAAAHGWKPEHEGRKITGVSASPGLAIARVQLFHSQETVISPEIQSPADGKRLLGDALAASREELDELYEQVRVRSSAKAAQIFRAHQEFLSDASLREEVEHRIEAGQNATLAWQKEIDKLASSLEASGNAITAGRAVDIRDVGARVVRNMQSAKNRAVELSPEEPVLLLAKDLTPSQTAAFDPSKIAGFCTSEGSATSHVAILARSLNIPAVTGAGEELLSQQEGQLAILDADHGVLYLDPTPGDLESARVVQQRLASKLASAFERRFQPAMTTDDVRVEVCANIGRTQEAAMAIEAGGEGVGLLRTEFLFLQRDEPPSEDEQYEAYREMVEKLDGLPLVLRTLDIGGDKNVPYLKLPHEDNPFLGVRGIRLCLRHPELFRPQLRAAYRASVHGNLKLMFSMISSPAELREAKQIAEEIRKELGVAPVQIGTMIEVPSAVIMADELAREADFFSVGTNDLTQYVLAMDRGNSLLAREAQNTHPAVLRMIAQTVEAATKYGKWVGVCGGLAGDPIGATILIGLGVKELSMAIPSIAAVKAHIRSLSRSDAQILAQRALACEDAESVRALYLAAEGSKSE